MSVLVECNNLTHRFDNKVALKDVNFTLKKGQPIALVGPNGAGKTTLFRILCGYLKPSHGEVKVMGYPAGHPALFGEITALPQDAQFDPGFSIGTQLDMYARLQAYSSKQAALEVDAVLEKVGLINERNTRINDLSHGMKKRVAIAQSLIGSPKLVILDEATAGLDPKHAKDIRNIVHDLKDQVTFILSSHDLNELERLCGSVLYLEQGKLSQLTTLDQQEQSSFLTVLLTQNEPNLLLSLQKVSGYIKHSQGQQDEVLIEYKQTESRFDLKVLELIHELQVNYRQISRGRSLESRLFS